MVDDLRIFEFSIHAKSNSRDAVSMIMSSGGSGCKIPLAFVRILMFWLGSSLNHVRSFPKSTTQLFACRQYSKSVPA